MSQLWSRATSRLIFLDHPRAAIVCRYNTIYTWFALQVITPGELDNLLNLSPEPISHTTMSNKLVELDGRTLEGGGQLLRLAVGMSALHNTPVRITDIRGNRSGGGGLKAQHLACVSWLAHASNASVLGAEKGSRSLEFTPRQIRYVSPAYRLVLPTSRHKLKRRRDQYQ